MAYLNVGRGHCWTQFHIHGAKLASDSHAYVFVNLKDDERPEYIVAPSTHVAAKVVKFTSKKGSVWYSFMRKDRPSNDEGWGLFGDPQSTSSLAPPDASLSDEISN